MSSESPPQQPREKETIDVPERTPCQNERVFDALKEEKIAKRAPVLPWIIVADKQTKSLVAKVWTDENTKDTECLGDDDVKDITDIITGLDLTQPNGDLDVRNAQLRVNEGVLNLVKTCAEQGIYVVFTRNNHNKLHLIVSRAGEENEEKTVV